MSDMEKVKLDPYEQEIEDNLEKAQPVENLEEWKRILKQAAENTLRRLEEERVTLKFSSPELKEKALQLLEEHFGKNFEVVES